MTTICRFGLDTGTFHTFTCPPGEKVLSISGRAGESLDAIKVDTLDTTKTYVAFISDSYILFRSFQFKCDNGTESEQFGGEGGDPFDGGQAPNNL
jgi:hypothetical protein